MGRWLARATLGLGGLAALDALYVGMITGRITVDLEVGRRVRSLGPLTADIAAPPEVAFDVAAAPYGERRPRAMQEKVDILHRGAGMVLAAHRTPLRAHQTAVTVETVSMDRPHEMGFRLLRGPLPYVSETFTFEPDGEGTRLRYTGELGTDLWAVGARWGDLVARHWEAAVSSALEDIKAEAERRTSGSG